MAVAQSGTDRRLMPILDEVARMVSRVGIGRNSASGSKATLRIELEDSVKRVVQVYWTGFEANVPGQSIGLHLEVAEPRVHWAECYLSPEFRNWVFCFQERADGDIQLARYGDYATPQEALRDFFDLGGWYVLTATDLTWDDVTYEVSPDLPWSQKLETEAGTQLSAAISESLKKSTIIWLRYRIDGAERTMPVWFVYDQKVDKIYVLSGERQQMIPGAEQLRECEVILRWKMKNARVAELPASVRLIDPSSPDWETIAEKVAEKRLNIPGLPEDTAQRWRSECVILELTIRD